MSSCFVCSTAEKNEYIREVSNRVVGVDQYIINKYAEYNEYKEEIKYAREIKIAFDKLEFMNNQFSTHFISMEWGYDMPLNQLEQYPKHLTGLNMINNTIDKYGIGEYDSNKISVKLRDFQNIFKCNELGNIVVDTYTDIFNRKYSINDIINISIDDISILCYNIIYHFYMFRALEYSFESVFNNSMDKISIKYSLQHDLPALESLDTIHKNIVTNLVTFVNNKRIYILYKKKIIETVEQIIITVFEKLCETAILECATQPPKMFIKQMQM